MTHWNGNKLVHVDMVLIILIICLAVHTKQVEEEKNQVYTLMDVVSKEDALRNIETQPNLIKKYFDDGIVREIAHLHYDRLFNFFI